MYRSWGVLASAILAVALEIAIKLVADSVAVPREYHFAPIVAFVILVCAQVLVAIRDQQAPERGAQRVGLRLIGHRHNIKGEWNEPPRLMKFVIFETAILCLTFGGMSAIPKAPRGLLIATLCFVTVLAVFCVRVALGSRVHLQFSGTGVTVWRSMGRKRRLRWDEATRFRVSSGEFVATPIQGSTWYLRGWDRIDSDGVIYLCNLSNAGIPPAAVQGAIDHWTQVAQPNA